MLQHGIRTLSTTVCEIRRQVLNWSYSISSAAVAIYDLFMFSSEREELCASSSKCSNCFEPFSGLDALANRTRAANGALLTRECWLWTKRSPRLNRSIKKRRWRKWLFWRPYEVCAHIQQFVSLNSSVRFWKVRKKSKPIPNSLFFCLVTASFFDYGRHFPGGQLPAGARLVRRDHKRHECRVGLFVKRPPHLDDFQFIFVNLTAKPIHTATTTASRR